MVGTYKDLKVWQKAMDLAEQCYCATRSFPAEEKFGLTSQIRRSASSIPANVAEGYGRDSDGSFVHFLRIAQGSLKELETHIILSERLGFADRESAIGLLQQADETGRMLRGLIKSVVERSAQ